MRDIWELPKKADLVHSGPDWLLLVLDSDAECVEAMACLEGIRIGVKWPDRDFILESDNASLIDKLRMGGINKPLVAPVIHNTG
ncbi:hypothetical protein HU200_060068 [Digitaria exilis]|uniref:RNase H type-1 domain-containing protein n=1 Tax=Digitaria exilis TaxID=1010633 RepID=A0A835E2M5_9POAL|nr:hypothetical protein HU200_060068 [Digitaria exilis]